MEAQFETKVLLTWSLARVIQVGEYVPALEPSVRWRHPCHGATICREMSTEPLVVDVSCPFPLAWKRQFLGTSQGAVMNSLKEMAVVV